MYIGLYIYENIDIIPKLEGFRDFFKLKFLDQPFFESSLLVKGKMNLEPGYSFITPFQVSFKVIFTYFNVLQCN